jgi:NADH-quinone oxidoreductase subunit J
MTAVPNLFYVAAAVAIVATLLALTRTHVVHGLLYLVVALLAIALVFFALGAPFVAALEAILYAGAIIVLFVFVVMMLGLASPRADWRVLLQTGAWVGPTVLCAVLAAELIGLFGRPLMSPSASGVVSADRVGAALFGPYVVGVELASMPLLGALVGAYHLGRRRLPEEEGDDGGHSDDARPDPGRDSLRPGTGGPADTAQPDLRPDGS